MNNQLKNVIIAVLVVVVAVLVIALIPKQNETENEPEVNADVIDFLTCVDAGYPVLETFPEQCRTPDGRLFTDDINENAEVMIDTPMRDAVVSSPLTVTGKAKGNWFFEDNLPVTLKDANGKVLVQKGAQSSDGNWMTADYVNFTVVLTFAQPETDTGILYIEKDNPSGLPENAGQFAIPVRFR